MTFGSENPVTPIATQECWELLAAQQVGRLATAVGSMPDIVPINFVVDGSSLVFRTAAGSKLFAVTINATVALEVDNWTETGGWSVVARGLAHEVTADDELTQVEALPLRPWVPTIKQHFVRISVNEISGRRFAFGDEPEVDYTLG